MSAAEKFVAIPPIHVGFPVPRARLAELDDEGRVRVIGAKQFFARGKSLVVGAPGAYTPICTHDHLPEFVACADQMRTLGYDHVICIVTSDPYSTAAWAKELDPAHKMTFLSDGNLEFSRATGLVSNEDEMFLGERSRRYIMTIVDGVIARLRIEPSTMHLTCTRAGDACDLY